MDRKMIPLHRDKPEYEQWREAERIVREELGLGGAREGQVLGAMCSAFIALAEGEE